MGALMIKVNGRWENISVVSPAKGDPGKDGLDGKDGDPGPPGPSGAPPGGAAGTSLSKVTGADGDVAWDGPFLKVADAALLYLPVTTDLFTQAEADLLYVPVNDYAWEEWNAEANLAANWSSDATIGPCKVWRNRFSVVVNMCLRRAAGTFAEDTWMDTINAGSLPVGWRPQFDLWDTRMSVEGLGSGSLFEIRVTNTGSIQVKMKGLTLDWQDQTRTAVYFSYMRAP